MDQLNGNENQPHQRRQTQHSSFPLAPTVIIPVTITLILTWLAIFEFKKILSGIGAMDPGMVWSSRINLVYAAGILFTLFLVGVLFLRYPVEIVRNSWLKLTRFRLFNIFWAFTSFAVFAVTIYLVYGPNKYLYGGISIRLLFYWWLFWLGWSIFLVFDDFRGALPIYKVTLNALLLGVAITMANTISPINAYPLTASWSEGSVLYYASAFVSKRIYGVQIGLPVINPGRAALQSLPFLIPGTSIIVHRIWDVFLWIIFPLFIGYSLVKRLKINNIVQGSSLILFTLLFLNLGPVYYHLLVVALIVLIGFNPNHFWRSLAVVALASLWAGLTRINWYPMAGSLAAILYWLETPSQNKFLKDVWKPLVWFAVGFAVSLLSFQFYVSISGTPAKYFENPFTTRLLWYRLFPSATNPNGLLQGILLASIPALLCAGIYFFFSGSYAWIRRLGVFSLLASFLLGGFLVSVRIGGGNNLHNFDAFFLILLILVSYGVFDKIARDSQPIRPVSPAIKTILAGLLLILPLYKPLSAIPSYGKEVEQAEIQRFHDRVEADVLAGKSVLLVDNPHLIAFDFWRTPPAAPEFEKVFLMEAAMTRNQAYLEAYYKALNTQKYDYIVTEHLSTLLLTETHAFGEENDAWVKEISIPTLCYYEVTESFEALGLDYLAPRDTPCADSPIQP